jgi:hypothetical protein
MLRIQWNFWLSVYYIFLGRCELSEKWLFSNTDEDYMVFAQSICIKLSFSGRQLLWKYKCSGAHIPVIKRPWERFQNCWTYLNFSGKQFYNGAVWMWPLGDRSHQQPTSGAWESGLFPRIPHSHWGRLDAERAAGGAWPVSLPCGLSGYSRKVLLVPVMTGNVTGGVNSSRSL